MRSSEERFGNAIEGVEGAELRARAHPAGEELAGALASLGAPRRAALPPTLSRG